MTVSLYLSNLPNPGAYARDWRRLLTLPAGAWVNTRAFGSLGDTAGNLRRDMRRALDARINTRGGLVVREASRPGYDRRVQRGLARTVRCYCGWCGFELPAYKPDGHRFCCSECARACRS